MEKQKCQFGECKNLVDLNEIENVFVDGETLREFKVCEDCKELISNDNSPKTDNINLKGFCGCGNRIKQYEDGDDTMQFCEECR